MLCPQCRGEGIVPRPYIAAGSTAEPDRVYRVMMVCDYPGCHGGHVHCCEGDQAGEVCDG